MVQVLYINILIFQPVMTGLPITEVVHTRTVVGADLPTFSLSGQTHGTSPISRQVLEPHMAAVNLSTKCHTALSENISSEITATRIDSRTDQIPTPFASLDSLSDFPSFRSSHNVPGTTVNPLLMTLPKFDSKAINVSFPPTQRLLQTANNIPTQTVVTGGLMQADSSLSGITSLNPDSLTIRITNVSTEQTNQGNFILTKPNS